MRRNGKNVTNVWLTKLYKCYYILLRQKEGTMARKFDISVGETTPAGRFVLDRLINGEVLATMLKSGEFNLSIYNGGQHTLILFMSTPDFAAFYNLIEEQVSI